MISFLTYEVYLSKFLILTSFVLLIFITLAVIYISYVSWKDKKRLNLIFTVNKGEKYKISKINFIGDKKIKFKRLRDVINLVTSIEIPLPDSPDSLDENDELLDGPTILPK